MEMNLRSSIVDDSVKMLQTSMPLLLSILVHVDTDIPLLQQKQIIQSSQIILNQLSNISMPLKNKEKRFQYGFKKASHTVNVLK